MSGRIGAVLARWGAAMLALAFVGSALVLLVFGFLGRPRPAWLSSVQGHPPFPAFVFMDQSRRVVNPGSLRGRVWIANAIFTQCRSVCPSLTAKMAQLQRQLTGPELRFVSFSVDPQNDTPERLAEYAKRWNANETRWLLLSTDAASLSSVALAFGAPIAPSGDADSPILHASSFLLVDAEGRIRGRYDVDHREGFLALIEDAQALAGQKTLTPALPADGAGLYHALSCAECHEHPELAPSLWGIEGKSRELDSSLVVKADAAYVRESILSADAKRVRGYPLRMPSYDGLIDEAALTRLVEFIVTRPAAPSSEEPGQTHRDPICHMEVREAPDTPRAERGGKTLYFCSDVCRSRFLKLRPVDMAQP